MAIETLGKSLLQSAKKKSKRQEKKAKIFTGLMLGVQAGNVYLRNKAEKRAKVFWNNNAGVLANATSRYDKGINFWKFEDIEVGGLGTVLEISDTGEMTASQYPAGRDDSGTFTPTNILYTDGVGNILSSNIQAVIPVKEKDLFTLAGGETSVTLTANYTATNHIEVTLNGQELYEGPAEDWTAAGNVISFSNYIGIPGHKVQVRYY